MLIPCTYIAPSIPKPWQALKLWLASECTSPAKRKEMVFGFILRLEKLRHWLTGLCTTPSDREKVSGLSPGMCLLSGSTLALPNKAFILRLLSQHSDYTCFAVPCVPRQRVLGTRLSSWHWCGRRGAVGRRNCPAKFVCRFMSNQALQWPAVSSKTAGRLASHQLSQSVPFHEPRLSQHIPALHKASYEILIRSV